MKQLDHIVYAVPDLGAAVEEFEARTGIRPVFGGYHKDRGTKNALVSLGHKVYLEFLAIDAESEVTPPRWMGIDLLKSRASLDLLSMRII